MNGKRFFLVLQATLSNPTNPTGRCGAGNEISAVLYSYENKRIMPFQRVPVSSCLNDYYLDSQLFSDNGLDDDFSSIKWEGDLIRVSWYLDDDKSITGQFNLKDDTPNFNFLREFAAH